VARATGSLWREPLVHFLALGAGLFLLYAFVGGGEAPTGQRIVVDRAAQQALEASFRTTWQRAPSEAELEGLIDEYVRETILYREAIALGLDRDDAIVRQRMRQKLELLAESRAELLAPEQPELEAWLRAHPERFRREGRSPALAEVHDAVLRDWQAARAAAARESFYAGLRARYEVVVERGADARESER
jgi:hypothetical protein